MYFCPERLQNNFQHSEPKIEKTIIKALCNHKTVYSTDVLYFLSFSFSFPNFALCRRHLYYTPLFVSLFLLGRLESQWAGSEVIHVMSVLRYLSWQCKAPPALSFPEIVKMHVEKQLAKAQSRLDCQTTTLKADSLDRQTTLNWLQVSKKQSFVCSQRV